MKTRSSSGVGTKLDLGYDMNTLRITDLDEDDDEGSTVTSIYQNLKTKTTVTAGEQVAETKPETQAVSNSDRLQSLLKRRE